jgi:nucleoside-diphosphate-sugar epimerase
MQTILGSGGAIGVALAKELTAYTDQIRLVSRNPEKVNDNDNLFSGDLTKESDVNEAVKGSKVVYLTVGLQYSAKVWEATWPVIMKNVIAACKENKAKLVFFDNIYMYDPNFLNPMDENTPINPTSKKGKLRAHLVKMIMDEVEKGNLKALIARSADFYGPGIKKNGVIREMIFNKLAAGEKANWLASEKYVHSVTYTPDAAKATALLGNTEEAYGQVWHLPTAVNPLTGKEWVEAIARELNVKPKLQVATKFIVRIMSLFMPIMKEMIEMMYQYDRAYVFDSKKFESRFNFKPTPYVDGIKEIVNMDYSKKSPSNF